MSPIYIMATYEPPTEDLTYPDGFNPLVFQQLTDALTIEEGDARYLRFPLGQGAETIPSLTVSGTLTTVDIEPSSASTALDIAGTQVSGALTIGNEGARTGAINIGTGTTGTGKTITIGGLASANTTTINGGIINISGSSGQTTTISNTGILSLQNGSSSAMNIGSSKTGGNIDIGMSGATASTTTINIGVGSNQTGAINIGTGNTTSAIPIIIGNQTGAFGSVDIGTTTITVGRSNTATNSIQTSTGGTLNLKTTASSGGTINMGTGMTSGDIKIGRNDGTSSTTAISIGTGSNQTGGIEIGSGGSNKDITIGNVSSTANSTFLRGKTVAINAKVDDGTLNLGQAMTGGSIVLGGTTGGTNTLTLNRPFTPAYLPSAIGATNIGHIATPASAGLTPITTGTGNLANFSLDAGVWDVQVRVRITGVTAFAGNFFRLSLSTNSGTQSTYINDWFADNATGSCSFLVNGKFSLSATTTIYVVGIAGGGVAVSTTTNADVQAMRIA